MSDLALRLVADLKIYLLDPLGAMLDAARAKLKSSNCVFVAGTFELMNFPDACFDVVMCGFSLRDARNLDLALREVHRVLKPEGGRLLVVDLGKPDAALMRHLVGIYWRYFVPLLALVRVGKRGRFYSVLYKTYRKLPENGVLKAKLQALFKEVEVLEKMGGATVIIRCMR
jgi:demethylmenaquinone methyltransferase/2-methoxy-6-polyprenyl-1,4-benzoquinol methylase